MIPIRDTTPTRTYPYVNNTIIGLNVVIFLLQLSKGADLPLFIYTYGLVPAKYTVGQVSGYFSPFQLVFSLVSFMFLHGGFWHLIGNMWSLYIFGDNVEDRLGPGKYILFYLLCGISSGLVHFIFNLHSNTPVIGASGAISGIMGAYFLLHPRSRILTLVPVLVIPFFFEIPAFVFLGIWFLLQFLSAMGSHAAASPIAWWAHIGGFLFGILYLRLFTRISLPEVSEKAKEWNSRKTSHRFQVIQPRPAEDGENLYGSLSISPYEASTGTHKLVNIPWGFYQRMFRIHIPPNTEEGNILRLKGLGKIGPEGVRGDLYLKVNID